MSTFAKNGDLKSDSRCHYRANFCPHLSLRKVRPVMQSKYSLTGKSLNSPSFIITRAPAPPSSLAEKLDVWSHQNLYLLKAVRLRQVT